MGRVRQIVPIAVVAIASYGVWFTWPQLILFPPVLLAVVVGIVARATPARWWTLVITATLVTAALLAMSWLDQRGQVSADGASGVRLLARAVVLGEVIVLTALAAWWGERRRQRALSGARLSLEAERVSDLR